MQMSSKTFSISHLVRTKDKFPAPTTMVSAYKFTYRRIKLKVSRVESAWCRRHVSWKSKLQSSYVSEGRYVYIYTCSIWKLTFYVLFKINLQKTENIIISAFRSENDGEHTVSIIAMILQESPNRRVSAFWSAKCEILYCRCPS